MYFVHWAPLENIQGFENEDKKIFGRPEGAVNLESVDAMVYLGLGFEYDFASFHDFER
jgi:hypothetical protein